MIEVRPAGVADLPAVAALNLQVHQLHLDAEPEVFRPVSLAQAQAFFADRLESDADFVLLATVDGDAAGYVLGEEVAQPAGTYVQAFRRLQIHQIAVDPGFQQRGVGRALVEAALSEAKARGVDRIATDYWTFNDASAAFFRRLGFMPYHVRLRRELAEE